MLLAITVRWFWMMVAHVTVVGCIKETTKTTVHCRAYRYNGHNVSEIETKEIFGSFQIIKVKN